MSKPRNPTPVINPDKGSHYLKKSPSPTGAKSPPGGSTGAHHDQRMNVASHEQVPIRANVRYKENIFSNTCEVGMAKNADRCVSAVSG